MKTSSICFSLLCLSSAAHAVVPDGPEFGLIGGGQGEVASLNAVADQNSASGCQMSAFYADLLGRAVTPVKAFNLPPGAADSIELNFSTLVSQPGARAEVRPVVKYFENSGPCRFSLEMYDQTLRRTIVFSAPATGRPRAGIAPKFPMVGLVSGQNLRLAVGAFVDPNVRSIIDPNDKCRATLEFRNSAGAFIDPNVKVTLDPGQWKFVDLNANALVRSGQRVEIHPVIQVDPSPVAAPAVACVASAQVYDQFSGWTTVHIDGALIDPNN